MTNGGLWTDQELINDNAVRMNTKTFYVSDEAPTTTYAGMVWIDLSGALPVVKVRNTANTDWVTI